MSIQAFLANAWKRGATSVLKGKLGIKFKKYQF